MLKEPKYQIIKCSFKKYLEMSATHLNKNPLKTKHPRKIMFFPLKTILKVAYYLQVLATQF